jgi:hypothetical protein
MRDACVFCFYLWIILGLAFVVVGFIMRLTANSGFPNNKWAMEDDEKDQVLGAKLIVFGLLFPVALPYLIIKNLPKIVKVFGGVFKDAFRSKI